MTCCYFGQVCSDMVSHCELGVSGCSFYDRQGMLSHSVILGHEYYGDHFMNVCMLRHFGPGRL